MVDQANAQRLFFYAIVALAAAGCQSIPEEYPEHEESSALPPPRRAELKSALDRRFGTPKLPKVPSGLDLSEALVRSGQLAFKDLCAVCHGVLGDGDGLVRDDRGGARDFRRATFKFGSTGSPIPTREDIERRVLEGLPGTRMPPFADEPAAQRDGAIEYLCFIAQRGAIERRAIAELADDEETAADELVAELLEDVAEQWRGAKARVIKPRSPFPPKSSELVARGRELFRSEKAQCADCHGPEADGEGRRSEELEDDAGRPIEPADLTEGEFRGGSRPIDLYHRIAGGIPGTPMPAMRSVLSDEEIWSIVHYIRDLSDD